LDCKSDLFGWRHLVHRTRFKAIMRIVNLQKDEKIADIGCAQGLFTCEFQKRGATAYGVDIHKYSKNSRNHCGYEPIYVEASIYDLPFEDNFFDKAFVSEMITSLDDPIRGLKEVNRVLKNDGVLILSNSRGYKVFENFFFSNSPFFVFSRFILRKLLKQKKQEFNPQELRKKLSLYLGCSHSRVNNYNENETKDILINSGFAL